MFNIPPRYKDEDLRKLFELHQQLVSSYVSETDLIRASLPYLSCAFPSVSIGLSIEI